MSAINSSINSVKVKDKETRSYSKTDLINSFSVDEPILLLLEIESALYFSYLLHISNILKAVELNKGWFSHTSVEIFERINIPDWKQTRLISKLRMTRLVSTERRGAPSKLFFRINYAFYKEQLSYARILKDLDLIERHRIKQVFEEQAWEEFFTIAKE